MPQQARPQPTPQARPTVTALYDYDAATADELSFKEGDSIVVIQKDAGMLLLLLLLILLPLLLIFIGVVLFANGLCRRMVGRRTQRKERMDPCQLR